jgi:hypothetical protein
MLNDPLFVAAPHLRVLEADLAALYTGRAQDLLKA